jgi:hypothetical protein
VEIDVTAPRLFPEPDEQAVTFSARAASSARSTPKERIPLWKKELYEGGEEWIGRGS